MLQVSFHEANCHVPNFHPTSSNRQETLNWYQIKVFTRNKTQKKGKLAYGSSSVKLSRKERYPKCEAAPAYHTIATLEKAQPTKEKLFDMVTFGNLCVDVLVQVDELPPKDPEGKWNYMQTLMANPPDKSFWEAGGNANTLIAGSRLGLKCSALGHVGRDVFGNFFLDILKEEGIGEQEIAAEGVQLGGDDYHGETLVVWVMVDPSKNHAFCSRFDFNKDPVFSSLNSLPEAAVDLIQRSRSFLINGFIFDEVPPKGIVFAAQKAREAKTPVLFDPGPRTTPLVNGGAESKEALLRVLGLSDVVLLTADEAEVLTGMANPTKAAFHLLEMCGENTKWVIIKRGSQGCILATRDKEHIYSMPGFKVDVSDTVGCGDSFSAAICLGFSRNKCPSSTLALANAVGAATAQGSGAGRNVARAQVVENILLNLRAKSDDEYVNILEEVPIASTSNPVIVGPAACSSGTPLHVAIDGALELLREATGGFLL